MIVYTGVVLRKQSATVNNKNFPCYRGWLHTPCNNYGITADEVLYLRLNKYPEPLPDVGIGLIRPASEKLLEGCKNHPEIQHFK